MQHPKTTARLFLFALAAATLLPLPASASARPNIVFVLADDLGYGDVGVYGGTTIQTPEIDALAESGVRFTQGYVSHPVCSPSRAGLMTGRYQQRHGWEFNPAGRDRAAGLSLDQTTLGDVLRAAGYRTGLVGKWHLGQQPEHRPTRRGFDEYFGILEGGSIFVDSRKPGVESASLGGGQGPTERHNTVWRARRGADGQTVEEAVEVDEYLTDVFTREAVDFVGRSDDRPFFLFLSHTTPHTPLQATAEYLEPYRHIDDAPKRVYAAMVASLDASVGRLRQALEEQGKLDDTLFVFASDNGCAAYVLGACSNAPLRGFKRYHHEGGIRVPFVMSWPARLAPGQVLDTPVSTLDLLATFAAAAGSEATTEDSVDLVPFLASQQGASTRTGPVHEALFWKAGDNVAVRSGRWKLIELNRTVLRPEDLDRSGSLRPPPDGWPASSSHGQLTLLYDIDIDPSETTNRAAENPDIVARLRATLKEWRADLAPPILPAVRSTLAEVDGEWVQLIF